MIRTDQQNKSIHLLFTHLAAMLNEAGLDMRVVLKPEIDIPWTPKNIKEYLWRPLQTAITGKESTKDLETKEIDQVFEILQKHLGERFGLETRFPSVESMLSEVRRLDAGKRSIMDDEREEEEFEKERDYDQELKDDKLEL